MRASENPTRRYCAGGVSNSVWALRNQQDGAYQEGALNL